MDKVIDNLHEIDTARSSSESPEPLNAAEIWGLLWTRRLSICVITGLMTLVAAAAAFLIPKEYQATVLMQPVSGDVNAGLAAGLSSALSQLGGLASLAGLSTPGSALKVEAVAVLQSRALTEQFIKEQDLLPVLYGNKWNKATGTWKRVSQQDIPTLWKASRYFNDHVRSVTENARTGLVSLTISWRDPAQAAQWANGLVTLTNEYLRQDAIRESDRNINYLEQQAKRTNVLSIQNVIATLTENEIKTAMLARGRQDYALKVLDPAAIPELPEYPKPLLWIGSAFLAGLFVAVLSAVMRSPSRPS